MAAGQRAHSRVLLQCGAGEREEETERGNGLKPAGLSERASAGGVCFGRGSAMSRLCPRRGGTAAVLWTTDSSAMDHGSDMNHR